MYFIIDSKLSSKAKLLLQSFGDIIPFASTHITYEAISNHPDIFMCSTPQGLILARNTPTDLINQLEKFSIPFLYGSSDVKEKYPYTSRYNAVITDTYLIHNLKQTDEVILHACTSLEKIHVEQGYTRCNLLALKNNHFITSDKGIENELIKKKLPVLFVNSTDIELHGFKNGFFGGCCGIYEDTIFINGTLQKFNDGALVKIFLEKLHYNIIELDDSPLRDCGSILHIKTNI